MSIFTTRIENSLSRRAGPIISVDEIEIHTVFFECWVSWCLECW